MQSIGIYSIINRKNNKRYIGQSVHLGTRMRQHFLELKAKKHPNKILQKAYNRDSEYFNFEVLELTTLDKLNEREAY
jgi:group I intron endonuclease